jgi:hypothetical protein
MGYYQGRGKGSSISFQPSKQFSIVVINSIPSCIVRRLSSKLPKRKGHFHRSSQPHHFEITTYALKININLKQPLKLFSQKYFFHTHKICRYCVTMPMRYEIKYGIASHLM